MADSIVRLRVDSQEYDNKLKRAAEGLNRYIEGCRKAGGTLEHVDDGVKEFTQQLGKMETVAGGAKGKLGEMTKAFTDLTMQFNAMTEAEKRGQFGKALSSGLDELKQRIISTKQELAEINSSLNNVGGSGGGGLFGGGKLDGMLQVFGGNVMTKLAGAGMGFVTEMGDMVKQGIELARAGEGIRIAFERLGRGDLLDGLRQATHGTVTDLELMKAAVKFNDFKLPLEELGTMLAFAQQKAKDTGQSVEYMTESIVTGLGRKSLMILDNLGLSASEVKERMAETGDMTKAVGAIIREQMAKAGDYVETAADRATQANVSLQNKMEELGRKFAPVEEASNQLWTSMKIGILEVVGGPLAKMLNSLTESGRLMNALSSNNGEQGSGNTKVDQQLNKLRGSNYKQFYYNKVVENYTKQINDLQAQINNGGKKPGAGSGTSQDVRYLTAQKQSLEVMRGLFKSGAKDIMQPVKVDSNTDSGNTSGGSGGGGGNRQQMNISFNADKAALAGEHGIDTMPSVWKMLGGDEGLRQMMGIGAQQFDIKRVLDEYVNDPDKDKREKATKTKDPMTELSKAINGLTSIKGGLEGMGIKLPAELEKGLNVLQGLMSIIQGVQAVISIFSTSTETANTIAVAANTVALGALTTAVTANTMTNFLPFAHGGVVKAANGYVSGTTYSGDQIPAMLNAGEVVLNRSQAGVLAASLQAVGQSGEGGGGGRPYVSGELIWLGLNNYLNRSGRGEIVTSKRR